MKEMKLYHGVNRIYRQLEAVGLDHNATVTVADLTPFDQYHYHGTAAVDAAITAMGLKPGMRVLDIGSGIGGPARYLAHAAGVHVTALELQPDLHEVGLDLTQRSGMSEHVEHICGNVLDGIDGCYDAALSMLCFMHIDDKATLFKTCRAALRDGGTLYIEDYGSNRMATAEEAENLKRKVQCNGIPTVAEYGTQLHVAGFEQVTTADVTVDWTKFTAKRLATYRASRNRHVELHGEDTVAGLEDFYATVAGLLGGGLVAGLKIVAR